MMGVNAIKLILGLILLIAVYSTAQQYLINSLIELRIFNLRHTLCTLPQYLSACEQLNRSEEITCIVRKNTLDCLLLTEEENATFTVISPDDAVLASNFVNNTVVIGEFRNPTDKDNTDYSIAVIVKNDIKNFQSLRGAKLCHPGIETCKISPAILNELEIKVIKEYNIDVCSDKRKSTIENYVRGLNDFFGRSCRPGRWTANHTLDSELKAKYPKLLQLCEKQAYMKDADLPLNQALNCVLNEDGDIGITSKRTIKNQAVLNADGLNNFKLLCKNGSTVNVTEGCTWTTQPGNLVVANADMGNLQNDLRTWFADSIFDDSLQLAKNDDVSSRALSDKLVQPLKEILFPQPSYLIKIIQPELTLEDYLSDFRDIPSVEDSQLCKRPINWCVSDSELTKCRWLRQAIANYGIQPGINCISRDDETLCINNLQSESANLATLSDDRSYYANRKNISIIGFGEQALKDMKRTILVVDTQTIQTLDDIKGKKGCFSEYGDRAFLAFILLMEKRIWHNSHFFGEKLNQFFNESCMPGIEDDQGHEPYNIGLDFFSLCALCEGSYDSYIQYSCKPDYSNAYFGNQGALDCLEHKGDYAVLTSTNTLKKPTNKSIKVMCKNGTLANSNELAVDDDCVLSITTDDVIFSRHNDSRLVDILVLLTELENRFALHSHTSFKIFDRFGNQKDLIFQDATIGIEMVSSMKNKYMKTQFNAFKSVPDLKPNVKEGDDDDNSAKVSNLFLPLLISALVIQIRF